jgi:DNA-binding transcriptional LysR family regulator
MTLTRDGARVVVQHRVSQASCNDAQALYQLARAGAGLAAVPAYLARDDLKAGRIETVLPDWELDPIQMYLDWPVNAPRRGIIRLFVNEMSKSDVVI